MDEWMDGPGPCATLRNHGRTLNGFELEGRRRSCLPVTRYRLVETLYLLGTGNFFVCPFVVYSLFLRRGLQPEPRNIPVDRG